MTPELLEKTYTVPEFLELDLPDEDDDLTQYELVAGKIVKWPFSNYYANHGSVLASMCFHVARYANKDETYPARGVAYVRAYTLLGEPEGVNFLVPDLSYVNIERVQDDDSDGPLPTPDLVVEINSSDDTTRSMYAKIQEYLKKGVRMVWSVYLHDKFVLVYGSGEHNIRFYGYDDELDGGEVLPGFRVAVGQLFE